MRTKKDKVLIDIRVHEERTSMGKINGLGTIIQNDLSVDAAEKFIKVLREKI